LVLRGAQEKWQAKKSRCKIAVYSVLWQKIRICRMPVTYSTAAKTARMNASRTGAIDGTFELLDGSTVIAAFTLSNTAGSVTGSVWTLAFVNSTVAATGSGTVDGARIRTDDPANWITGLTVGTTGTDVIIQNTSINADQQVTITSATVTHAPDPE
jgi:hypothetical protein